jgi:glycosyltransferase involved in cell wall biosynthesis
MTLRVAVATSFPAEPARPVGGVEAVSVALLRGLAALGELELHVVTLDGAARAPSRLEWEGVTVHRLPQLHRRILPNATGPGRRQVSRFLLDLRPDVVHAHDVYGLMVKGLPLPRVFTVHGFIHEDTRFSNGRLAWLRARLWRHFETAGWADQPHIVSISPYVRERLSPLVGGRIHDIDNPISEVFFDVKRRDTEPIVFSAGAVCARKNTLGLLAAFARLRAGGVPAVLRLAGGTPEPAYVQAVRDLVRREGLEESVTLLGNVSSERVREELATAAVFALVSLEEGSPMSIEEAMAAGVPVVASDRCGIPYLVQEGDTGYLVDPRDADDVARALSGILSDRDLGARMGRKAREVARERFHPAAVARRTLQVYRRAAADGPPQPRPSSR